MRFSKYSDERRAKWKAYASQPHIREKNKAYLKEWQAKNRVKVFRQRAAAWERKKQLKVGIIQPPRWTEGEIECLKLYCNTHDEKTFSRDGLSLFLMRPELSCWKKSRQLGFRYPDFRKNQASGSEAHKWTGEKASQRARENWGRKVARRLYKLGPCEKCGKPGEHRHHIDANTQNNLPSNISILCAICHMVVDGRLEKFIAMARRKRK